MENKILAETLGGLCYNLFFNKKVTICFDTCNYNPSSDFNVLVQLEPPAILDTEKEIINNKNNFDLILTYNENIIKECNNSEFFPFGTCWINNNERKIYNKSKLISIIASNKRFTEGHILRHSIINEYKNKLDLFGGGYNHIENKITGLMDYKFSVVIENSQVKNYFTEKIIDCFAVGTVPIYWGCPNISDFFDNKGILIFNSIDEFNDIILNINDDTYEKMLHYVKINYEIAKDYFDFWVRLEKKIENKINGK
jgi:hypothetical protein